MTWKFRAPLIAGPYTTFWATEQMLQMQRLAWMSHEGLEWARAQGLREHLAEISPVESGTES